MSTTGVSSTIGQRATRSDPAYQAFLLLRTVAADHLLPFAIRESPDCRTSNSDNV
jgi:hypothetical protein